MQMLHEHSPKPPEQTFPLNNGFPASTRYIVLLLIIQDSKTTGCDMTKMYITTRSFFSYFRLFSFAFEVCCMFEKNQHWAHN